MKPKKIKARKVRGAVVYDIRVPVKKEMSPEDAHQLQREIRATTAKPSKKILLWTLLVIATVIIIIFAYSVHLGYYFDVEYAKELLGISQKKEPPQLPDVINPSTPAPPIVAPPTEPENTDDILPPALPEPSEQLPEYDFLDVIAGDDYFADAAFIGDSRTEGLRIYTGLKTATYLSATGLMVDTLFTKAIKPFGFTEKITVIDAIEKGDYTKFYIMLGVNELGWTQEKRFITKYEALIDEIRRLKGPECIIYIQGLIPITESRSSKDNIFNNSGIASHNAQLMELAKRKDVVYLNVSENIVDENGVLPEEASKDGIHLKPKYYKLWLDYLRSHTVAPAPTKHIDLITQPM